MPVLMAMGILAIIAGGCATIPVGGGLGPVHVVGAPVPPRRVWLAGVKVVDPDIPAEGRPVIEDALTVSLKEAMAKSGQFQEVRLLPGVPAGNDIIFRLTMERYHATRRVHPAYFPLAILTLTVYIWAGGPVVVDRTEYAGTLTVERPDGSTQLTVTSELNSRKNISIWEPESSGMPDIISPRSTMIADLLGKACAQIEQAGGPP